MLVIREAQKHKAVEPSFCNTRGGQAHGIKQSVELSILNE